MMLTILLLVDDRCAITFDKMGEKMCIKYIIETLQWAPSVGPDQTLEVYSWDNSQVSVHYPTYYTPSYLTLNTDFKYLSSSFLTDADHFAFAFNVRNDV